MRKDTGRVIVKLNMTDHDVIVHAAALMGSTSFRRDNRGRRFGHKDQWVVWVSGERAKGIMRIVLPYMGARRAAKIHEILGDEEQGTLFDVAA